MGINVIRLGADATTGHSGFPPVVAVGASGNVRANSKGVVRQGDMFAPHAKPKNPPHSGAAIGGGTVRTNGLKSQRKGDGTTCGDTSANGSNNVRFG